MQAKPVLYCSNVLGHFNFQGLVLCSNCTIKSCSLNPEQNVPTFQTTAQIPRLAETPQARCWFLPPRSHCICLIQTCRRSNKASVSGGSAGPEFCWRLHRALDIAAFLAGYAGLNINMAIKKVGVLRSPLKQP